MKAIVCEMCGSQDLIKQDGYYVCQNCGTKYAPEEAKKLMVEVSGAVKVDNSEKIENLYVLARRAYKDGNWNDAENYYSQLTVERPKDWEAQFYKGYCNAWNNNENNILAVAQKVRSILRTTFELINNELASSEAKKTAVDDVYVKYMQIDELLLSKMSLAGFNENMSQNELQVILQARIEKSLKKAAMNSIIGIEGTQSDGTASIEDAFSCAMQRAYIHLIIGDGISPVYPDKALASYKIAAEFLRGTDNGNKALQKAKMIDPTYELPLEKEIPTPKTSSISNTNSSQSGGCYVATAVYGSYDCPQVWTLRRYRDYTLAETWYGRVFVRTYYAISPPLVKWFGEADWFKVSVKRESV